MQVDIWYVDFFIPLFAVRTVSGYDLTKTEVIGKVITFNR